MRLNRMNQAGHAAIEQVLVCLLVLMVVASSAHLLKTSVTEMYEQLGAQQNEGSEIRLGGRVGGSPEDDEDSADSGNTGGNSAIPENRDNPSSDPAGSINEGPPNPPNNRNRRPAVTTAQSPAAKDSKSRLK